MMKILMTAVLTTLSLAVLADGWTVDANMRRLVETDGAGATNWDFNITIASTNDHCLTLSKLNSGAGDLNLCTLPDDYAVVDVGGVFKGNKNITSLTEPDRIYRIAGTAFNNCSAFTNFTGGGNVTVFEEKDNFYGSKLSGRITLPKVTRIPFWAFNGCSGLREVIIPNVTYLSTSSFDGCGITNFVYDAEKLTYIGAGGFPGCARKGDLCFPNVTYIGGMGSGSLTSINLPKVKTMAGATFYNCSSLTNFYGGAELEVIEGKDIFWGCPKLTGSLIWPKLRIMHGNSLNESKVKYIDFSSVTNFSTQFASSGHLCSGSLTNLILGPVKVMPDSIMASAKKCHVHWLGDVPEFKGKAFDNSNQDINFFHIHRKKFWNNWESECFTLKAEQNPDYASYFAAAPKRTAGLMRASATHESARDTWGWAYVINDDPPSALLFSVR